MFENLEAIYKYSTEFHQIYRIVPVPESLFSIRHFRTGVFLWTLRTFQDHLCYRTAPEDFRLGQIALPMPIGCALLRLAAQTHWGNFPGTYILPCKIEKKTLDLQIFNWIGKIIKKIPWIADTVVKISVLVTFWCQSRFIRS